MVSRSGDRAQFEDMVRRCNDAGVQIYVDAVINHMTGSRFPEDPNFGVGSAVVVDRLTVNFPSGSEKILSQLPVDSRIVVEE